MHQGKLVFAQVMAHLPLSTFRRCVARYGGEHKVKSFSCLDQFYAMAFAQLTFRESLRDIEACLARRASGCITWDFARPWRATRWPMPTRRGHGRSTPIWLST